MVRRNWIFYSTLCVLLLACGTVMAQPQQGGGQGQGQGRGNNEGFGRGRGGRGDPAAFMQNQLENIREQLEVNDAEWQVLMPKVQRVLTVQQEVNSGRGGGRGGRGRGGGGRGGFTADNAVARAMQELRDLLANPGASGQQISDKLNTLRTARKRAEDELAAAQKDLKELLTPRQEALLVTMGTLQ